MNRRILLLTAAVFQLFAQQIVFAGDATNHLSSISQEISPELSSQFEILAAEWVRHCNQVGMSSKSSDYLDHPSYRKLVSLGPRIIPLIIERYQNDDLPWWGFMLQEITGVSVIENVDAFSPGEVRKRWLEWWRIRTKEGHFSRKRDFFSNSCCALVVLQGMEERSQSSWDHYSVAGLMIAPASKQLSLPKSLLKKLSPNSTVREIFQILGVGLLYFKENHVEWYFENGSIFRIKLGKDIDQKPASAKIYIQKRVIE